MRQTLVLFFVVLITLAVAGGLAWIGYRVWVGGSQPISLNLETESVVEAPVNTTPPTPVPTPTPPPNSAQIKVIENEAELILDQPALQHKLSSAYMTPDWPGRILIDEPGLTWGQFMDSIPLEYRDGCFVSAVKPAFCDGQGGSLSVLLNGVPNENFKAAPLQAGDVLEIRFE